jgi:hypothetical protein
MKTSIILSLFAAMTLSAPVAANAGDGAVATPQRHHVTHRRADFAKATASVAPAPAYVIEPQTDADIFAAKPEDCARLLCVGY